MDFQYMGANLLQGMGVLAIAVALIEFAWRQIGKQTQRNIAVALVLMLGIIGTMSLPFHLDGGFVFDLRYVFLVLAGPLAGIVGLIGTAATATVMRVLEGGAGMYAGLVGVAIGAIISAAYALTTKVNEFSIRVLIGMGMSCSLPILGLLALPTEVALYVFKLVGPTLMLVHLLAILVAGHQLRIIAGNIEREKSLEFESKTDPLTGALNRRAFETSADLVTKAVLKRNGSYSLFVMDIDNFKTVNDTFGHESGDKVIKKVTEIVRSSMPMNAELSRFGGDEFVLLVPDADDEKASHTLERLRQCVQDTLHNIKGMKFSVTISAGYSVVDDDSVTWQNAFELADQALYHAKKNGRNKIASSVEATESRLLAALRKSDDESRIRIISQNEESEIETAPDAEVQAETEAKYA